MSDPVKVYRAWFHGAYEWGEGSPHTLGEPMLALPEPEFLILQGRVERLQIEASETHKAHAEEWRRAEELKKIVQRFVDGPPSKGHRVDGWASGDEYRVCGYCLAKSSHGDSPLAHYDDCVFIAAREALKKG